MFIYKKIMKNISNSIIIVLCVGLSTANAQAIAQAIPVVLGTVTIPACIFYNHFQNYWKDREIVHHVEKYATSEILDLCKSCNTNTNPAKACGDCQYFGDYLHAVMVKSQKGYDQNSSMTALYLCKDTLKSFGIKRLQQEKMCAALDAKIIDDISKNIYPPDYFR
jgi:hypothetical protein